MRMEGPHVGIICSCGHLIHGMCELQKILLNSGGCHQQHLLYIFRVKQANQNLAAAAEMVYT